MSPIWNLFFGNIAAILVGVGALIGWFRKWVKLNIQEPVNRVESSLDNLQSTVETAAKEAERAYERAQDAHRRIDQHLEGGHSG